MSGKVYDFLTFTLQFSFVHRFFFSLPANVVSGDSIRKAVLLALHVTHSKTVLPVKISNISNIVKMNGIGFHIRLSKQER